MLIVDLYLLIAIVGVVVAAIFGAPPALVAIMQWRESARSRHFSPKSGKPGTKDRKGVSPFYPSNPSTREDGMSPAKVDRYETTFPQGDYDDAWRWIDPDGNCQLQQLQPAGLRILAPDQEHDLWPGSNLNAPRFLRPCSGNFIATARVRCQPTSHVQGVGLLIWDDERNFARVNRSLHHPGDPRSSHLVLFEGCSDGLYAVSGTVPCKAVDLYLRIAYSNNAVTAAYSLNSRVWHDVGATMFFPSDDLSVGFVVLNQWGNTPFFGDLLSFSIEPV